MPIYLNRRSADLCVLFREIRGPERFRYDYYNTNNNRMQTKNCKNVTKISHLYTCACKTLNKLPLGEHVQNQNRCYDHQRTGRKYLIGS